MSYVQGTQVKLKGNFKDLDTDQPIDPTEVILTIEDPAGTATQYTLSANQVQNDTDVVGLFFYVLDTTPMHGPWKYQFESTGNEKVVGIKQINVRPRLPATV